MNLRFISAVILGISLSAAAAQDANAPQGQRANGDQRYGGQRNGAGGFVNIMGRGVTGAVTDITPDHFTIKTANGETYTVHYSANTRFMKQAAGARTESRAQTDGQAPRNNQEGAPRQGQGRGMMGANPPQPIKAADIKVGDAIAATGEVDSATKSVGAIGILQLDPERARQMQQMQANYGKTWLLGKVTAVNELQVTLQGSVDNAPHTFVADENTTFRERNNPITLSDIHVNDIVRVEGALKDGVFTAAAVNIMRPPADATRVPRSPGVPDNLAPPQ